MKEREEKDRLQDGLTEEKMERLKDAYDKIEIPDKLRPSVLEMIENGKNRSMSGSKIRRLFVRTGQTAAAALIAVTVLANSGAAIAYAMEQLPVIGAITKIVTFRTYEKKEGNREVKIEIPKIEAESGAALGNAAEDMNKSVEEYTNRLIAQFEADVAAGGEDLHEALYSGYEVVTDNDRLFTLRINTTQIMASGAESVKIYNINKKTDEILELRDLFPEGTDYIGELSVAVRSQMEKNRKEDGNKSYFLDDGFESDFKAIKENQNFYFNSAGKLVLVFDEYEVAPGYMGIVEIEIPAAFSLDIKI